MLTEKYQVIYADPPWRFSSSIPSSRRREDGTLEFTTMSLEDNHYPTMSPDELREFFSSEVSSVADDDSVLLMWTTDAHLPLAIELGTLAGFSYRTIGFIWNKKTSKGNQVAFMGRWTVKGSEICLLFTKGSPHKKLLKSRKVRQLIEAERREHSRKPAETITRIETMFPDTRKLQLFARSSPPGWDVWGNETEKFASEA